MIHPTTTGSGARQVLRGICEACNSREITVLLKLDCTGLEYEQHERGLILTFHMRDALIARQLYSAFASKFTQLKEAYKTGAEANLYLIRSKP